MIGFTPGEHQLYPGSTVFLAAPTAVYWHPTVGPAMTGDTMLVQHKSAHFLTAHSSWPTLSVQVKGHVIPCPAILRIPSSTTNGLAGMETETIHQSLRFLEPVTRLESVWEPDVASDQFVFEEDSSPYSDESVLE